MKEVDDNTMLCGLIDDKTIIPALFDKSKAGWWGLFGGDGHTIGRFYIDRHGKVVDDLIGKGVEYIIMNADAVCVRIGRNENENLYSQINIDCVWSGEKEDGSVVYIVYGFNEEYQYAAVTVKDDKVVLDMSWNMRELRDVVKYERPPYNVIGRMTDVDIKGNKKSNKSITGFTYEWYDESTYDIIKTIKFKKIR